MGVRISLSSDGLYIQNKSGDAAYVHFRTWVADNGGFIVHETADIIRISIATACNNYIENNDNDGFLIGYTCTN